MKRLTLFMIIGLVLATAVSALPAVLDKVVFDGNKLQEDSINRLNIERGEEYTVQIVFTSLANLNDVEIEAFISGYEYSTNKRISDMEGPFDTDINTTYSKKLKLEIPDDADEDSYKLRIIISDRNNEPLIANFNLKIALPRHDVDIEDIMINPNKVVEAGSAIIVTVRVENNGIKDEDDVRVEVKIPELGLSNVEYIDEIESEDEESTEEIFIRIPRCTEPGVYDVIVEVAYSNKHETVSAKETIQILRDESCDEDIQQKTVIMIGTQTQSGIPGSKLIYPITFTNKGNAAKMFTLSADAVDWAEISVQPTNTLVVSGKDTQTVYLNIDINEDAEAGTHMLNVKVSSDEKAHQVTLTADIIKSASSTKGWLEFAVIALVIIVIILGLIVVFKSREEKDYY